MKKLFILLFITSFFYSCGASNIELNYIMNNVYIGMPIDDFNNKFTKNKELVYYSKELVSMKSDYTIYLMHHIHFYRCNEPNRVANPLGHSYFYFNKGKLAQMDNGKIATDLSIKIDK
jgi:hypothetical protein